MLLHRCLLMLKLCLSHMMILQVFMIHRLNVVVWMHITVRITWKISDKTECHHKKKIISHILMNITNCFNDFLKYISTVLGRPMNSRRKSSLVAVVIHFWVESCPFFCPCTFVWMLKSFKNVLWSLSCYWVFFDFEFIKKKMI